MTRSEATGPPRFGDEEIQRILQRAADLQEERASRGLPEPDGGLTLAELRQVAVEAGIDPDLVDAAAGETMVPAGTSVEPAPPYDEAQDRDQRWRLERTVVGALPPGRLDWVLRAIRGAAGDKGEVDHVSGHMEWRKGDGSVKVAVGSRGGDTRIEVVSYRHASALTSRVMITGAVGLFGGMALTEMLSVEGGPLVPLVLLVTFLLGYLISGLVNQRAARSHRRYLEHILTSAAEAAADVALPPASDPPRDEAP